MVEMLIVVAIVGIISTVAIPLLMRARATSLDEKARQSVRNVLSAQAAYYALNSSYTTLDVLALVNPPFLDQRFESGAGLMGNSLVINLQLTNGGQGFLLSTDNPGGLHNYQADETMTIAEL